MKIVCNAAGSGRARHQPGQNFALTDPLGQYVAGTTQATLSWCPLDTQTHQSS